MIKDQMEKIYSELPPSEIPWNIETPPEALISIIKEGKVKPCKTIDLGCGTGNYAIYLASQGFDVTGIDISPTAIELARNNAVQKGTECSFIAANVLEEIDEALGKFAFAYDWELLHHIFPEDREKYFNNVYRLLKPGGLYLSVFFSEESPQFGGKGKYRKTPLNTVLYFSSESEILKLVKPLFKVIELKTVKIQGKHSPHKAIYTLLKK